MNYLFCFKYIESSKLIIHSVVQYSIKLISIECHMYANIKIIYTDIDYIRHQHQMNVKFTQ